MVVLGSSVLLWPEIHIWLCSPAVGVFFAASFMCVPLFVPVELDVSRFRFVPPHFRFQCLLVDQLLPRYLVLLLQWPPQ